MGALRMLPLVLALLLCFSSTRTAVATHCDLLADLPADLFTYCGPKTVLSTYYESPCPLPASSLKNAMPSLFRSYIQQPTLEATLSRNHEGFLLPLYHPHPAPQHNLNRLPIHKSSVTFLLSSDSKNTPYVRFPVSNTEDDQNYDCWLRISETTENRAECSSSSSSDSTVSIAWTLEMIDTIQDGVSIKIVNFVFADPSLEIAIAGLPDTLTQQHIFLISFIAVNYEQTRQPEAKRDSHEVQYEALENNSTPQSQPSTTPGFLDDGRIVGLTIAAVVLVVILIILMVVVVVNGQRSGGLTPPGGVPVNATLAGSDHPPDSKSDVPSSFVVGSSTTASTGSPSPMPISPIGNSPNPIPGVTGGVISTSMSSALRGTHTPSSGQDTPLHNAVGNAAQSATAAASSASAFSPRFFSSSPATTARSGILGSLRPKKEKVILVEAPLMLSPKYRGPAIVSDALLASLPQEPPYTIKPSYLLTPMTPRTPPARKQIHFKDVSGAVAKSRPGTMRSAKSASKMSRSSSAEELGDLDNFIGDSDGAAGIFMDDNDDWINDIVEPDPDDPVHQNDENYMEIDLDKMALAPVSAKHTLDSSIESLDLHITSLTSPLSQPASTSSLSRSSSAASVCIPASPISATSVTETMSDSTPEVQDIPLRLGINPTSNPSSPRGPPSASTELASSSSSSPATSSPAPVRSWTKAKPPK